MEEILLSIATEDGKSEHRLPLEQCKVSTSDGILSITSKAFTAVFPEGVLAEIEKQL